MRHPFFAAEVRENVFNKYFDGKADLNYVMRNAVYDKYYMFDLGDAAGGSVRMRPIEKTYAEEHEFFPEPGAFARSHTHTFNPRHTEGVTVHRFGIDGNWQANDFSHFHAKIANLYGLFSVLRRLDDVEPEIPERAYMRQLVRERFWRGGGSYVGFYDELYDHIRNLSPLEVESIVYQSPGQIVFRGDAAAFAEIDQIVDVFSRDERQLRERYRLIHGILRRERLLREGPRARFSTPEIAARAREEATTLATGMRLDRVSEIMESCDNNSVVFCKIIMSIYRRANELYTFHAEGRVQFNE
jgi:hypothetical protein